MSKKDQDVLDQISKLKEQLRQLEGELSSNYSSNSGGEMSKNGEKGKNTTQKQAKKPGKGQNRAKNGEKWQKSTPKLVEGIINENLNLQPKEGSEVKLDEKSVVDNQVIMGDEVILEYKNGEVDKFKVARRAKREVIEALVTEKEGVLYAVSQHGVHKLLDYDVKTKGVLKGFEVNLLVPKENEAKAKVCVVKDIESSGNHKITKKEGAVEIKKAPDYDPRVLDEDDLV